MKIFLNEIRKREFLLELLTSRFLHCEDWTSRPSDPVNIDLDHPVPYFRTRHTLGRFLNWHPKLELRWDFSVLIIF